MTDYLQGRSDFNSANIPLVYDETSLWSSRFGAMLLEHLELRRNVGILDLGCGTGFPLFELAHVFGRSCKLTGLDVWKEALAKARVKQGIYKLPNIAIVEADGARMPFAAAAFDLIVSNLGINNFERPETVLAEAFRVLKPGGAIALTTNLAGHMREFYEVFREVLSQRDNNPEYLRRLNGHEAHRGTKETVRGLLEGAEFATVKVIEDSFQMRYLDGNAFFNHSLTRIGFLDSWRAVVNPDPELVNAGDEIELFGAIERKLNEIAARDGELRMTVPMLYVEGRKR